MPGCVAPLLELTSCTAVKAAVVAGNAPAVVSSLAVAADLVDGRLAAVELRGLEIPRRLLAVWDRGRGLRGSAREDSSTSRRAPDDRTRPPPRGTTVSGAGLNGARMGRS